ncbi:telomere length and silencing protein 1 homolog [Copidosoma floridanum]|uniref:telomere length and silencing protein 1 homolog n=1 Tax=Copidosoma floridanum TaxID=29053 RepID=UPI0006C9DA8C|nr:telomere length and silencing protein 1 homolog [Copidosoma floridanum]
MTSDDEASEKIVFKKKKVKALRKRKTSSSDENSGSEDNFNRFQLEELRTVQKLRERPKGVNIVGLALGEAATPIDRIVDSDPFKVKAGGMVNMAALKNSKIKQDDAYDTGIGTQFNAETNKRDEDDEMVKYIEEELQKRKNKNSINREDDANKNKMLYCSPEEAALQAVPEHLRQSSSHKSEEMLSNQMLSGIPEVDLGIEAKIRNIESTEEAKLKLLWERHRKKDGPSQFVPTNMAVNFVQHNRFNLDDDAQKRKRQGSSQRHIPQTSNSKDKRKDSDEKATDDYHYERFKKQFRRF